MAGNTVVQLRVSPDFISFIESGSLTDGLMGSLTFENAGGSKELKVYYVGKGVPKSPRLVTTVAELQAMKDNLAGHYLLMNDLTVNNWLPIGDYTAPDKVFSGSLDGLGHHIILNSFSNEVPRSLDSPDHAYLYGLMGFVKEGQVKNLHMQIAASAQNIKNDILVLYGGIAGGLVGNNAKIENCRVSGALLCSATSDVVSLGGIVGVMSSGAVTNCVSTASINATSRGRVDVGGLAGGINGGTLSYSYATAKMEGRGVSWCFIGGLVGQGSGGAATSCVALMSNVTGSVAGGGDLRIGRIAGDPYGPFEAALAKNYANTSMSVSGGIGMSGATTKHGESIALSATRTPTWWQTTGPGFVFSNTVWKWNDITRQPKPYWEN